MRALLCLLLLAIALPVDVAEACEGRALRVASDCPGDGSTERELELVRLVNRYRRDQGRRPVRISPALFHVANRHLREFDAAGVPAGNAFEVCENQSPEQCMWTAAERYDVAYQGPVYGMIWKGREDASPAQILAAFVSSEAHRQLLMNRGDWTAGWTALGVAVEGGVASIWVGTGEDNTGWPAEAAERPSVRWLLTHGGIDEPAQRGLLATYHEGRDFGEVLHTRVDRRVDFNWSRGAPHPDVPEDEFSVRWRGWLIPRYTGEHQFRLRCDDGQRLFINGVKVVDDWTTHPFTDARGSVELRGGEPAAIQVEFFEAGVAAGCQLFWTQPNRRESIVPASVLRTPGQIDLPPERSEGAIEGSGGLSVTYFADPNLTIRRLARLDRAVDFNWGIRRPARTLPLDGYSSRWSGFVVPPATGSYTFKVTADDGVRLYIDGVALIDAWEASDVRTLEATVDLTENQEHAIRLEYYDAAGASEIKLEWEAEGITRQVVPANRLMPGRRSRRRAR